MTVSVRNRVPATYGWSGDGKSAAEISDDIRQTRYRLDADGPDIEPPVNGGERHLRDAAAFFIRRVEHVRKRAAQIGARPLVGVGRNRARPHDVEPPHLIEAHDVIGVAVRVENGIDARDVVGQRLLPQVGGRIDEDRRAVFDVDEN